MEATHYDTHSREGDPRQSGGEEDEAAATDEGKAETLSEATSERDIGIDSADPSAPFCQRHSLCVAL